MANIWILGHFHPFLSIHMYVYIVMCLSFWYCSYAQLQDYGHQYNTFTVSSITYAKTELKPYDWRYIRVDIPPWFASMSIALESDVDIDLKRIRRPPKDTTPMICIREGSPPLPDVHNISLTGFDLGNLLNGSFGGAQNLQVTGKCYPMQRNISLKLTNEQISPGVWYFGLFNGIGPMRTQSKMINRGSGYSFGGNVSIEGCSASMMLGQFCNQTIESLSCTSSYNLSTSGFINISLNQMAGNVISCRSFDEVTCHEDGGPKVYSLDLLGMAEKFSISALDVQINQTNPSDSNITIMCYAQLGAIPSKVSHDYSGNIHGSPLVIESPRLGRWYIMVELLNLTYEAGKVQGKNIKFCYSLGFDVVQCPVDKAGSRCAWERYAVKTVLRRSPSAPFESFYLPISDKVSPDSANFPLEPLLSNGTSGISNDTSWTFFLVDIPSAAGGNIHIHLSSDDKLNFEIYAKYGGLPTLNSWDYFYANRTSSSMGSMFFKLYDSNEKSLSFYILYARGGIWSFGLRHTNPSSNTSVSQTTMSISLERCPKKCSSHGSCQSAVDASGLTLYSYCSCDRNHGGFDCSVELVSHQGNILKTHAGHKWQSISLIASNAAAVLPAYWALRNKAFAEWILFTSSGISSALYHACDVGTWCALTFHVLQFMDFWLSFMAVVSTYIYLTTINETSKRTIFTIVVILTALMAETGPTRSSNIVLVMAIGAAALLFGWLIEFSTHLRSFSFSSEFYLNWHNRWQSVKAWSVDLIKMIIKRFRWGFTLAGFVALAMAAISWTLENSQNYWFLHSAWHVSIYTSSFLFLCSKANVVNYEDGRQTEANYQLARQNSFTNGEQRVADGQT
ncbi:cell adhesion molecule [Lithospermum erythrorhizon]|uniref:Cell adhesion molecule n=1 Tax=Lithospermum erythrorhizon TaxID=34254 RepID=A0AAV3P0S8_LITER